MIRQANAHPIMRLFISCPGRRKQAAEKRFRRLCSWDQANTLKRVGGIAKLFDRSVSVIETK